MNIVKILIIFALFFLLNCKEVKPPNKMKIEIGDDLTFSIISEYISVKNISLQLHTDQTIRLADFVTKTSLSKPFQNSIGKGIVKEISKTDKNNNIEVILSIYDYGTNFLTVEAKVKNLSEKEDLIVRGFSLSSDEIIFTKPVDSVLSNGYQSWSPSLFTPVPDTDTDVVKGNNDDMINIDPSLSWWYSAIQSENSSFVSGSLTSEKWKTRVITFSKDGKISWKIINGLTYYKDSQDKIVLKPGEGDTTSSEIIFLGIYHNPSEGLIDYSEKVAKMNPPVTAPFVPIGWNSWNTFFNNIDESKIIGNAQFIKDNFPEAGFNNIQIDAGWEKAKGEWEANERFQSGMDKMAQKIKDMGFIPGIWIAPFLVDVTSPTASTHKDWFITDERGNLIIYSDSPGKRYYILDITNPEASQWLSLQIEKLLKWGYRYIKADFLFAGAYEAKRYDSTYTSMMAYRKALGIIFELVKKWNAYLLLCGAPILPSAGLGHGIRIGADIALKNLAYSWMFIKNEARNAGTRFFVNNFIVSDPDTLLLRDIPINEAILAITFTLLTGKIFAIGDDLTSLSRDKLDLIKKAFEIQIFKALRNPNKKFSPFILYSPLQETQIVTNVLSLTANTNSYSVPDIWLIQIGDGEIFSGIFNWSDETKKIRFDVGKIFNGKFAVKELWSGENLGEISNSISIDINLDAHSAKLLYLTRK